MFRPGTAHGDLSGDAIYRWFSIESDALSNLHGYVTREEFSWLCERLGIQANRSDEIRLSKAGER
jgi:hypothetical protein